MNNRRIRFTNPIYLIFSLVVVVLVLTAAIQIKCPICGGTGTMNATPGMEYVDIVSSRNELKGVIINGCDMYIMYQFILSLKVANSSLAEATGWIKTELMDMRNKRVMDKKYIPITVPPAINRDVPYLMDIQYSIWYESTLDNEKYIDVKCEVLTEGIEDNTCKGTGKIPLNTLLLVNAMDKKLKEAGAIVVPYQPPPWYIPSFE